MPTDNRLRARGTRSLVLQVHRFECFALRNPARQDLLSVVRSERDLLTSIERGLMPIVTGMSVCVVLAQAHQVEAIRSASITLLGRCVRATEVAGDDDEFVVPVFADVADHVAELIDEGPRARCKSRILVRKIELVCATPGVQEVG